MTISEKNKIIQSLKMYAGQTLSETVVMKEITGAQIVPVEVVENYETRTLTQRVKIPSRKMLDKSSLRYTIHFIDSNNMVVGKYKGKEHYSNEFHYLSTPTIKPGISASKIGDTLHISYVQNDQKGAKIEIYYRSLSNPSPFKSIKTIPTSYLDSGKIQVPYTSGMAGRLLVRAISFSLSGQPGAFADFISTPQENMGIEATPLVSDFGALQVGNSIRIDYNISGLSPGGPARVFLLKKVYKVGKNGIPALIGQSESMELTNNPNSAITDNDVIDGCYYEYSLILRNCFSPSTDKRINANNILIYYAQEPDWISVKSEAVAAPAHAVPDENTSAAQPIDRSTRPQYNLIVDLHETKTDTFFKFLKKAKIEDLYEDETKASREKISQFLVFKAERIASGETVDLGFFLPGIFKDPRPSGIRCKYRFKLYAGNKTHILESLKSNSNSNIPDYLLEDSRSKSLQGQTNMKASKTIFNIGNSEYSSVHESSNISGNTFDLHYTGAHTSASYAAMGSSRTIKPIQPTGIHLSRLRTGTNRVTWSVSNNLKIDHFIIVSLCNGELSIAGAAHHFSSNAGNYIFYDDRFSDGIGKISYGVIAVSTSLIISKPVFSKALIMR